MRGQYLDVVKIQTNIIRPQLKEILFTTGSNGIVQSVNLLYVCSLMYFNGDGWDVIGLRGQIGQ